jgi:PAS domain S-box-containing protein
LSSNIIHALLIEDDPDDVLLLKESLAEIGMGRVKLDYTDRLSRGLIQLSGTSYDVILLDLNLPDSHGLDTLNTTIKRFPRIPVVVLSGMADEAITVEAVRRGAQDYLVKGEISGPLVMRVMRYAIERKQIEAMLRASEARYRTLVETSPNGITLADLEGKIILCNQQAARMHRYDHPEGMIGMNVFKLIAPSDRQMAALNTQKTLNEGRITNAEYTLLRKDGSQFTAEISTAPIRNTIGAPTGFISITRDITEQKEVLEAEKRLTILKEQFIASVSHDLRTPLFSMVRDLDQLVREKVTDSEMQGKLLTSASKDANRLLDMLNELLDFLLLESDRFVLNWKKADLVSVIHNVIQSHREQAEAKDVSLTTASMDPSLVAEVDPMRMRLVLSNLVENAIIFSDVGGKILITGKSMNGKIIINVVDEGCGISLEDCSRIFDKYYQVSHTPKKNTYGLGLGLYIARQIVEAHGGSIVVDSQIGTGSTFTLIIPLTNNSNS